MRRTENARKNRIKRAFAVCAPWPRYECNVELVTRDAASPYRLKSVNNSCTSMIYAREYNREKRGTRKQLPTKMIKHPKISK